MAGSEKGSDWFKEFKKANNTPPPNSVPAPKPESGAERRRHMRFEVDEASTTLYREAFLNFIGLGKDNKARLALDLSSGGACVLTKERLKPGTRVRLRIQMEKYNDAVVADGEIRWCHQRPERPDYQAGVMFVDLDSNQASKIAAMEDWFTSPQYKAVRATRARKRASDIILPK